MKQDANRGKMSKSKNSILKAGKELFWKHGISRVSVEELCAKANVSKMTFYRNFSNKNMLALELMEELGNKGLDSYREIMSQNINFKAKVRQMTEVKRKQTEDFSMELFQDIFSNPEGNHEILEYIQKSKITYLNEIKADFVQAQKEGWIRKDIKIDFILHMLNSMSNYIEDPSLTSLYDSTEELSLELTNYFFHGILSDKTE